MSVLLFHIEGCFSSSVCSVWWENGCQGSYSQRSTGVSFADVLLHFLKIFLQFLQTKSDSAVGERLLELPILSINVVA